MANPELEMLAAPEEPLGNGKEDTPVPELVPSTPEPRVARRIAICGTAPSTRDRIPWNETDFEFWALNDAWKVFPLLEGQVRGHPRMVWFETHPRDWFTGPNRPPDHLEWLRRCPCPIYMWEHFEDIPNSVAYPVEEMCKMFPGATARLDLVPVGGDKMQAKLSRQEGYLTSTIAYMVALAISQLEPGDELWFWGVDLAADTEYFRQRPNLEYLLGYAQARGLKVALPSDCPILQGPAYGRSDPKDAIAATIRQTLEMQWQKTLMEKRKAEQQMLFLQGKTQAYEELRAKWPER